MKLTPSESRLLDLIRAMPGSSYCPGADATATADTLRLIRRLERRGLLTVEQTDDGYRYSLTGASHG